MSVMRQVTSWILGLIGAAIGGVLGYYIFMWIVDQGFYGLMIPGALLGLGCSLLSQHRSHGRGVICAAAACLLGLYSEWKFAPFRADGGFGYFVTHVAELKPITQGMIVLGAFFAYWLGRDAGLALLPGVAKRAPTPERTDTSAQEGS
jgi:hypothetical protein